jgi:CO/xanthine dehydrogenase FAD-binding subunit
MDLIGIREIRMPSTRSDLSFAPGEQPLGGGTWLFSEQQPGLTGLVDLTALGWDPVGRTDEHLVLAATCTLRELTRILPDDDWTAFPLVDQCANSLLMSSKIWTYATVGGNVATALPAGALTSLMVSLDAVAVLWPLDGGERRIPVVELVTGVRQTLLAPGEVVRAFEIPLASLRARTAFRRIALSNLGRSGALVVGRADGDGSVVVTITASTPAPVRLAFERSPGADELDRALDGIDAGSGWYDDPHGAPDWRRAMSRRFAHEVVAELTASVTGGTA